MHRHFPRMQCILCRQSMTHSRIRYWHTYLCRSITLDTAPHTHTHITYARMHTHITPQMCMRTHTCTHTHTHTHARARATHTHTHTRNTHTHIHSHTHSQSHTFTVTYSNSHTIWNHMYGTSNKCLCHWILIRAIFTPSRFQSPPL